MQYHYAKPGSGISEYRTNRKGECPDGLIKMISAPPHYDWVANDDGTYSEVSKSTGELFSKEMSSLNEEYDKNTQNLSLKFLNAASRDGSQEATKVASVRAEIAALDAQYESDKLAIINKYYGA